MLSSLLLLLLFLLNAIGYTFHTCKGTDTDPCIDNSVSGWRPTAVLGIRRCRVRVGNNCSCLEDGWFGVCHFNERTRRQSQRQGTCQNRSPGDLQSILVHKSVFYASFFGKSCWQNGGDCVWFHNTTRPTGISTMFLFHATGNDRSPKSRQCIPSKCLDV